VGNGLVVQDPRPPGRDLPRQFDASGLLIAIGAVALLVSLFLDWYGDDASTEAITAWSSFELLDMLLAALALAALYAVGERLIAPDRRALLPSAVAQLAGPVALVMILVSIIDAPPLVAALDASLEVGVWIALSAAIVMTAGTLLGNFRVSLVIGARDRPPPADPGAETRTMPADRER
jgi:hypothetical protein